MRKLLPFLHRIIQDIHNQRIELKRFIVYGSFVTNSMSKESDIDIAIQPRHKKDYSKIRAIIKEINKDMYKEGYKHTISAIIATTIDQTHAQNGILLWGEPILITAKKEELVQNTIITYDTTNLSQKQRAELSRRLFGYTTKISKKEYGFDGILEGQRLRNALIVGNASEVITVLKELGAKHHSTAAYLRPHANFVTK